MQDQSHEVKKCFYSKIILTLHLRMKWREACGNRESHLLVTIIQMQKAVIGKKQQ